MSSRLSSQHSSHASPPTQPLKGPAPPLQHSISPITYALSPLSRRSEPHLLCLLLIISLLMRLPFITAEPFVKDEALYAQMIDEFIDNPTLVPHFLGYEVGWRPVLFTAAYAPLVKLFSLLPLQLEAIYRLPSLFFALLSTLALYFLAKDLYGNKDLALLSALLFTSSPLTIFVDNKLLADTLLVLLILLSMLCYARAKSDQRYFLAAGLLTFCAYMVKTVVAFIIPVLAVAYLFFHCRPLLKNKLFLLSLLAIPLAIGAYYLMFEDKSILLGEYSRNVTQKLVNNEPVPMRLYGSAMPFIIINIIFVGFYLLGMLRFWKFDPFLLVWVSLVLFSLLGGYYMPWYFLPILPALSIFAALVILTKDAKLDKLALIPVTLLIITSLLLMPFIYSIDDESTGQRSAANLLAGKANVLITGDYAPAILFYKLHAERASGIRKEFCWLTLGNESRSDAAYIHDILTNFSHLGENHSYNTRVTDIFWDGREFNLPCNLSRFDYLALAKINDSMLAPYSEYKKLANFSNNITVYGRIS